MPILNNMPQALALESAVADIEGGYRAVTYPSGLAAVAGALLAVVKAGDHVLMTDSSYDPGRRFCETFLTRMGVETTFYDPLIGAGIAALMRPNTAAVYTESPGSHTFEVQDIPAIAQAAHAKGAVVILDNAWATGLFFNAFEHGVDLVIQPATKYYAAHSDVLMGLVIANEKTWPQLKRVTYQLGQRASPDDCFLTLRGMRTAANLVESSRIVPDPIFTPATKAATGHDENVPFQKMKESLGDDLAIFLRDQSLGLYEHAKQVALERGLILADTKFEFGFVPDRQWPILIDEALTPDSSRYWPANRYQPGGSQPSFDKQYVRDWLETTGWDKQSPPPTLPDDVVARTRDKYIECYEILTGTRFPWT